MRWHESAQALRDQAKVLNSEPIVYEPIIELQKNCESTEIIIFRIFMEKTNIYQLTKLFVQSMNI